MSAAEDGAFAPLRERVFAVLWLATVLGNVGSFMRDVASAWLATELSTSPTAVAAVQAAAALPCRCTHARPRAAAGCLVPGKARPLRP